MIDNPGDMLGLDIGRWASNEWMHLTLTLSQFKGSKFNNMEEEFQLSI